MRRARLGIVTIGQTPRRDVVPEMADYEADDGRALGLAVEALGGGEAGLVVLDCMGYRRKVKEEVHALLGVPGPPGEPAAGASGGRAPGELRSNRRG
jgi:AroM protein